MDVEAAPFPELDMKGMATESHGNAMPESPLGSRHGPVRCDSSRS